MILGSLTIILKVICMNNVNCGVSGGGGGGDDDDDDRGQEAPTP